MHNNLHLPGVLDANAAVGRHGGGGRRRMRRNEGRQAIHAVPSPHPPIAEHAPERAVDFYQPNQVQSTQKQQGYMVMCFWKRSDEVTFKLILL